MARRRSSYYRKRRAACATGYHVVRSRRSRRKFCVPDCPSGMRFSRRRRGCRSVCRSGYRKNSIGVCSFLGKKRRRSRSRSRSPRRLRRLR